MTITREQVADLQPGDVVDLVSTRFPDTIVRGTVYTVGSSIFKVGPLHFGLSDGWDLAVVSRAPRPLYVNHPRTEPVLGDIARDADDTSSTTTWSPSAVTRGGWWENREGGSLERHQLPTRLRLLVDGETGQAVS